MKTVTLQLTKSEIGNIFTGGKYIEVLDKLCGETYWSVIIKNVDRLKECINIDISDLERIKHNNPTEIQADINNLKSVLSKLN